LDAALVENAKLSAEISGDFVRYGELRQFIRKRFVIEVFAKSNTYEQLTKLLETQAIKCCSKKFCEKINQKIKGGVTSSSPEFLVYIENIDADLEDSAKCLENVRQIPSATLAVAAASQRAKEHTAERQLQPVVSNGMSLQDFAESVGMTPEQYQRSFNIHAAPQPVATSPLRTFLAKHRFPIISTAIVGLAGAFVWWWKRR
ncbi:MAG TPA: hypothetical protein VHA13_01280, partial [Gammaproteobacteria bacterium]|nr:hypothetical protein [Gammaproteobacteria bacterium]